MYLLKLEFSSKGNQRQDSYTKIAMDNLDSLKIHWRGAEIETLKLNVFRSKLLVRY